jgi:hypothetical protein
MRIRNLAIKQANFGGTFSLFGKALIGVVFAINLIAWHKILLSRYGLIDDHEIAKFKSDYSRFGFWDAHYLNSDFANWHHTPRFRPVNYFFRYAEATITNFNPTYQYGIKLGILLLNLIICYYILLEIRGLFTTNRIQLKTEGVIFTSIFLSISFIPEWVAVVGRLAPAEITAVPCALIMLLCAIKLIKNFNRKLTWFVFLTAQIGLIGSKEDSMFWVLLPIFVFLNSFMLKKSENRKFVISAIVISNVFTIFVLYVLYRGTGGFRVDYYGAEHKPSDLITSVFLIFQWPAIWFSALVILWMILQKTTGLNLRRENHFLFVFLFLAIVFQVAIYVSRGATERYILLPKILSYFILYTTLILLVEVWRKSQTPRKNLNALITGITLITTLGLSVQNVFIGTYKFEQYAQQVYASTNEFQTQLDRVLTHPNQEVLFFAQNPVDSFERTYSWIKFLKAERDDLKFFLNTEFMEDVHINVNPQLGIQLREFALKGNMGWNLDPAFKSTGRTLPSCIFLRFQPNVVPKICKNWVVSP